MTEVTSTTANTAKKSYTMRGTVSRLTSGARKAIVKEDGTEIDGGKWAQFTLLRAEGKKPVRVALFDDTTRADADKGMKATNFLKSFGEGAAVAVLGAFRDDVFANDKGDKVTYQRMVGYWTGEPKVKAAEAA